MANEGDDVKEASVAKAKGEEYSTGEEDVANHDSNDAVGEDGNVDTTTANGDGKKDDEEEGNDEEKDDSPPDEEEDANNASGKDDKEEENDAEENPKEDGGIDGQDEEEEEWELRKIFTVEEISNRTVMCNGVGCPNVACSVYQSTHDTNCVNAWFSCLDCQEL